MWHWVYQTQNLYNNKDTDDAHLIIPQRYVKHALLAVLLAPEGVSPPGQESINITVSLVPSSPKPFFDPLVLG